MLLKHIHKNNIVLYEYYLLPSFSLTVCSSCLLYENEPKITRSGIDSLRQQFKIVFDVHNDRF